MLDYLLVKKIHLISALLSGGGFALRGVGVMNGAAWTKQRWVKTAPHVNDTVLLLAGLYLAFLLGAFSPFQSWLVAKIVALLAYIVLGWYALRPGTGARGRGVAWVAALLCFGYMVLVAYTKMVVPI